MKSIKRIFTLAIVLAAFSAVSVSGQNYYAGAGRVSTENLEQQVFKKLISLPRYGVFDHLTYEVNGSTVILGGKTISLGTRSAAERVVKRIDGVTRVVNNIDELLPSPFDNRIRRAALQTFANKGLYRYLSELDPSVRIIVDRGNITLEGFVANSTDRNLFNIYARSIPGVFDVQNNLVVGSDRRR